MTIRRRDKNFSGKRRDDKKGRDEIKRGFHINRVKIRALSDKLVWNFQKFCLGQPILLPFLKFYCANCLFENI